MDIKIIIEEMHQSLQEYNKYLRRKSFNSKNIPSLEYSSLHDYLLSYSIRPLTSNEIFDLIKKEGRIYFAKDRLGTKYDITEIVLEEIIASCNQYNEIIQYVIDKYKDNMDGIYFKYFHKQYPNLEYFCANPVIVLENILNENIDENKKKEKICAFFSLTRPLKLSEEHLKELKRLNINFTYFEQFIEANNGNKSRVYKNIFNETYFFNNDTNEDKKTILTAILYNATNSEALYQNIDLNCISRDEIIEFIKKYQTQKYISDETIFNVIKHMFLSEEEITKLDALAKKVKEEFLKYLDKTFFLDIDEFISEYNKQYKDNFNLFYFNKTQNKKLDQTTLIFLFTKDKDEDKYESFIVNNFLEKPNSDRISYTFESEIKDRLIRNEVRGRYQHVIKALNNNRQYTYRYHIKINVPEQYVDTFYKILEYYTKINHPSIANNTFVNTPQQNDNTYQCILERVQKQISNDFSKRKQWMDKYYEWIIYYIGENYISKEKWQENLANIEKDYYEKVGLKHLNKILAIPDQNKKKIVSYVNSKNKNLDYDILETLKVVIERHPEYRETIEKSSQFL